ncbi:MAG TPA: sugar phosphate isomerase/epimerase, partial [Acidobacteriota bacterium]|nr:sugar phosphate isomerase/epimerase [Acidobacteriota bacterium]
MNRDLTRRSFMVTTIAAGTSLAAIGTPAGPGNLGTVVPAPGPMKIGIVTYNIAKNWDVPTIIKNCTEAKYDGVELRTGHAHGVEITLSPAQRAEVRKRFADSAVRIAQLGGTYEFHSLDAAEVRKNVEG